ncbi:MAG: chemotaxis-specific protein-glutamate methyltransferase CheB [Nitrospirota bacterium]|nr:chemotaxis-specific protein-glutamate methyltransferase CheB [Nitrospirota bacterium]
MPSITRVLVVDDSALVREMISAILTDVPDIEVVGMASNGLEATRMVATCKPDLVTMDLNMPVMDGFEATATIMEETPTPILILSSSIDGDDVINSMKSLAAGALDVMEKPAGGNEWSRNAQALREKVRLLSRVKVCPHARAKNQALFSIGAQPETTKPRDYSIIGIGVSTGGPGVLRQILKKLPDNFSPGIVIVQHITDGYTQGLAEWLDSECRINVKVAENGELIKAGTAYLAPDKYHIKVSPAGKIRYDDSPALAGHKPAADVLLKSIASTFGPSAVGIILTGMGRDGADGILQIKNAGGHTIAQNQESCVVFGMPKVAIELGGVNRVLSEEGIVKELLTLNKMQSV